MPASQPTAPATPAAPVLDSAAPTRPSRASPREVPATPHMCAYSFDLLLAKLNSPTLPPSALPHPRAYSIPDPHHCALFVTWTKRRAGGAAAASGARAYALRGCIGTLAPMSLHDALSRYVIQSAFYDSRFAPINANEVTELAVGISVLSNFETAGDVYDWVVGVHGIIITFCDPAGRKTYNATYLPEVAKEQGWDHNDAIRSLVEKAGWRGGVSKQLLDGIKLERYTTSKLEMSYAEFVEWKARSGIQLAEV